MPRTSWKGYIRLSLVSVPVEAYSASATENDIRLRQLHAECNSPINYRKFCPVHGEVTNEDIVSGYEYSKGEFVVIDLAELDHLRTDAEKSILIDGFVRDSSVDPIYWSGKNYYLMPQGTAGAKPYALLSQGMREEARQAVAKVTMFGREHVVFLRPKDDLLVMSSLSYVSQIRQPTEFSSKLESPQLSPEELRLAKTLIQATAIDQLDLNRYSDRFVEKLQQLIQIKIEGKQVVAPQEPETPPVIDLMDALKKSLAERMSLKSG
jgi:DNA end-binding protein Ku